MSVIDVSLLIASVALAAFVGVQVYKLIKAIRDKRAKHSEENNESAPNDVSHEEKKGE